MSNPPILEAIKVSKSFGPTRALADVTFDVRPGEVHALCGENGAGKSTLIKVLSGFYPKGSFAGELRIDGAEAKFHGVRDSERAGVAVVHQELALVDELSAAENVLLGRLPTRQGRIDWPSAIQKAREALAALGAEIDPERPVRELGIGQRQLVEIARALARSSRVLILDEPTAALADREVELVLAAVRRLCQRGIACIYISHKLSEVLSIADRISVLRDGGTVGSMTAAEANLESIVRLMVGREIKEVFPRRRESIAEKGHSPALEIERLSAVGAGPREARLSNVSLAVAAGEIVGVGGLLGSGRSELLMHLYGLWGKRLAGEVRAGGERYENPTPQRSLGRGLALVTEDRQRLGLIVGQSIGANLSLSSLREIVTRGRLDVSKESPRNAAMLSRLHLRGAATVERPVRELSGGNQQKVVIGRGLLASPRVILLDEPTRGVDIGARREIYDLIREMASAGLAVLMVSSELAELTGLCDRIAILREGRLAGVFGPADFDHAKLMAAATSTL